MDRDEAIKRIRTALRNRTGKAWSVTGGRGTAWGWITILSPPRRRDENGCMSEEDRGLLGEALGLDSPVHCQGVSIPASGAYRQEYADRAEGRTPTAVGTPYWD